MRREKFIFNQQTLQYDRVVEPLRYTILRIFGFFCAASVTAVVMLLLVHRYFPSPSERMLMQENDVLRAEIASIQGEFSELSAVLGNLQERDAAAHRMVFGMDPIDQDVWQGGRGGHDAYEDLRSLPRSGDYMAQLRENVDRLKHQMDLQSRSLDSITMMAEQKEDMLASIPSIKPIRSDRFNRKIENLSGFGYRIHPVYKVKKMHYGIDFNCARGTPIQASGKGKVKWAGVRGHLGKCVIIDHGYGFESIYAHMSEVLVKKGEEVERGATIGKVGSTGLSTGSHLHYEIHKDGVKVDPIQYCYDGLSTEEYAELVAASKQSNQSFD
ncbi:M23 family metallopeptidase [Lewinella sp. W8]|uniref:M23 family metallopeptidase n=1 Tax=Lewinella sp. W8 TaxID=2528208 RepID=UPI001067EAB5|nr:M23 family metallopeptidase [Lewinella sp. W8]MTB49455.1 peptidoglycan DD-metalloendopeptidase family protein [Lewinella sp. W8]